MQPLLLWTFCFWMMLALPFVNVGMLVYSALISIMCLTKIESLVQDVNFLISLSRSLGLNTVTAYQRAKVQALKIVNIRIGSTSNNRQRTLSEAPVFQVVDIFQHQTWPNVARTSTTFLAIDSCWSNSQQELERVPDVALRPGPEEKSSQ